jgi:lysophospholipase L1-like esterase
MNNKTVAISILVFFFGLYISYAQDWPNLNRYQKDNAELLALNLKDKRVVFMGNSITEGWLNTRPDFFKNKQYVNRGISGQTTPQMLLRFRQDVINLKPTVVVILAGINDIAENTGPSTLETIAGNIFSMCELARENGIKVIICSVLPAIDFPWIHGMEPALKVVKLNELLKGYADKHRITYVDYYASMVDEKMGLKSELGTDGIHPNITGYSIMEPLLVGAIEKKLK